ncbi:MAG: hypothetical protein MHM6MM_001554 [Cercozoa sp. M6MM]
MALRRSCKLLRHVQTRAESCAAWQSQAQTQSLEQADPEMATLIEKEEQRQFRGLELIASENFTSRAVMQALGSCLTNKYSEGLPGARYYGGNEYIDQVELLCQKRALEAFGLSPEEWGVNVQPYSGSIANIAAFNALLKPHERVMGLDLPHGGHLSHGYYNKARKVNISSVFYESLPYRVNAETGLIDYDELEMLASRFLPKLIVAGASAYPRDYDYERFRKICDSTGAKLMVDMAHYAGLVAGKVVKSPFEYADVVTTTTHKSLRGPRSALLFYRRELQDQCDFSVFPSVQGGPHNHQIAAVATQMKEVASPAWQQYAQQVVANSKTLAEALIEKGCTLQTGGSDNHLILWNLRPLGLTGAKFDALCDEVHITLNKNTVAGDKSALSPGGVRIGTPALTSRGLKEDDMRAVADFLWRAVEISLKVQENAASKKVVDFKKEMRRDADGEIAKLAADVHAFSTRFYMPGGFIDGPE